MRIKDLILNVKLLCEQVPNVHTFVCNNITELNAMQNVKYSAMVLTQSQHTQTDEYRNYNFWLFYVDRLTDDKSNEIDIQTAAVEALSSVLQSLSESVYGDISNITYNTFTQKFESLCAGAYATFSVQLPLQLCGTSPLNLITCEDVINELQLQIDGLSQKILDDQNIIDGYIHIVDEKTKEIVDLTNTIIDKDATIKERDEHIKYLDEVIDNNEQVIDELEDEVADRDAEIYEQQQAIKEKDEEIAYKNKLQSISITENGQYRPTMGNYAFDVVDVNVSLPIYDCAIYYTTTDGQPVQYDENKYDNIISNTYVNGIGCIAFDGEIDTLKGWFFKNKTLQTILIPSTIKTIENDAFADCDLVELYIPANVEVINGSAGINYNPRIQSLSISADNPNYSSDGNALMNHTKLQLATNNTVIPDYCTEILANAFEKKQLSTIDIPANVKNIGMFAFKDCTNLSSIYAYPTTAPYVVSGFFSPFNGVAENGVLHIPQGSDYTSWLAALPDGWTIEEMSGGEESERVKELEQKISSLNVEIASLNAEVNTQQETITRQAETIAGQEETIAVKDNTINELNALLVQKDKTIADQTSEIESMKNLAHLDITENGDYTAPDGYYAISTVNVNVGEGPTPPEPTGDSVVLYTTTDGQPIKIYELANHFVESHTYENGVGKIVTKPTDDERFQQLKYIFYTLNSNYNLKTADFSNYDSAYLKSIDSLFIRCGNLESVNFGNDFDTSKCDDFHDIFAHCEKLKNVDISIFDFSSASDISGMFMYCNGLESVNFGEADLTNISNWASTFYGCTTLKEIRMMGKPPKEVSKISFSSNTRNGIFYCNKDYDYSLFISKLPSTWTVKYI